MRACPHCKMTYATGAMRCGVDGHEIVEMDRDPLLGAVLGRYRIVSALGRGAMGCVYLASHAELANRRYAIKVLFGEMAGDRTVAGRFRREAEISSAMSHENVVPVIDIGTTEAGVTYLVMEYVEGRSLDGAIRAEGAFPFERAARIARELASGLVQAHALGVVHRDLKPGNVMLARREDVEVAKVLDFGIATLAGDTTSTKLTQTGHTVGTPLYMAPEQFRSPKVGPQADLYALGAILYEMIAGVPAFGGTVMEIAYAKVGNQIPPPPDAGGLGALAMQLLRAEPAERVQTAREVRDRLDQLIAARISGPQWQPPVTLVPITEPAVSSPLLDVASGVTDASMGVDRLDSGGSSRRKLAFIALASVAVIGGAGAVYLVGSGGVAAVEPLAAPAEVAPAVVERVAAPAEVAEPEVAEPEPDAAPVIAAPVVAAPGDPRREPRPQQVAEPSHQIEAPAVEPPAKVAKGRLNVVVMRGGEMVAGRVIVDGKPHGTAPLSVELDVGPHLLRVVLPDGTIKVKTVDVSPSTPARAVFKVE